MSCKFCDDNGICEFTYEGNLQIDRPVDEEGHCLCDEDPDPENQCEDYQER